ncbi:MAG: arginine--tRNA ligase [Candidatus Pacebacteria bacterium]|nr:arginine--tRNA ligase [Candidatus Paceibacterota bacterium]
MEERIRSVIQETLTSLTAEPISFVVEWPAELSHGDISTNVALASAKAIGKSPRDIAELMREALTTSLRDDVSDISVAGPGFVNIRLSKKTIDTEVAQARIQPSEWGKGSARRGQKIIFEYSCPNPFKEMHIGHLMSTVIGEASSRLIESQGAHVIRDSYGGDVGPHVAKALWAIRKKGEGMPSSAREVGEAYAFGSRQYDEHEDAKAEIDALNTKLYEVVGKAEGERDEEERELFTLWREGRDLSFDSHKAVWSALGTHFDYLIHESETTPIGMEVVKDALSKGVFEESQGAVIYSGEKKGLHTLVFITSRGTPTYETKDVGLAFLKEERLAPFDFSYIMTANEQSGHFAVFLGALEDIAPMLAKKTSHVPHGFLRLTEGKMGSRTGNVITAVSLLEDIEVKASEKNEDPLIAHQVAVGAVKYMILRSAPGSDIIFDPEKSLSLEGDSGPYLQYALVRARSIIKDKDISTEAPSEGPREAFTLARLIRRFPRVVEEAESNLAPHTLTHYLTELASEWNSFYAQERIIGGEHEAYKLWLASSFVHTLENGLTLLGIPAPEKM